MLAYTISVWLRRYVLPGSFTRVRGKRLRLAFFNVAVRIGHHARRLHLKFSRGYRWGDDFATAINRLHALGRPRPPCQLPTGGFRSITPQHPIQPLTAGHFTTRLRNLGQIVGGPSVRVGGVPRVDLGDGAPRRATTVAMSRDASPTTSR